jgi:hypothetical protein
MAEKGTKICPECGYRFKGYGFDGIDAHWRARHEGVIPYEVAWQAIKVGQFKISVRNPGDVR